MRLDELSKELLARYKKKAGEESSAADKAAVEKFEKGDIDGGKKDIEKANKRFRGIVKATIKEEDDLEEKKKKVVKDIIKSKRKNGPDNFDPNPEMNDSDTIVKT